MTNFKKLFFFFYNKRLTKLTDKIVWINLFLYIFFLFKLFKIEMCRNTIKMTLNRNFLQCRKINISNLLNNTVNTDHEELISGVQC